MLIQYNNIPEGSANWPWHKEVHFNGESKLCCNVLGHKYTVLSVFIWGVRWALGCCFPTDPYTSFCPQLFEIISLQLLHFSFVLFIFAENCQ